MVAEGGPMPNGPTPGSPTPDGPPPAASRIAAVRLASAGFAAAAREQLFERGFVVVRVSGREAAALWRCSKAATEYFTHTPEDAKHQHTHTFRDRGGGIGLVGWSRPHVAKEVLRCRRGRLGSAFLPACPLDLRQSILAAFDVVEACAVRVWNAVAPPRCPTLRHLGVQLGAAAAALEAADEGVADECFVDEAESDEAESEKAESDEAECVAGDVSDDASADDASASAAADVSASPFDLMFYANDFLHAALPNSTAHVDSPGLLTVVAISATPGLSILDQLSGAWVAIEELFEPHSHMVVFAAAALQKLANGQIAALTHKVDRHEKPRLSIVYELRAESDVAMRILAGGPRAPRPDD
ncbi:hypothetical protein M885DRAFT_539734 [Pelagophyceae sp. CCMP2097]|nr:hypothetical protein M885DRAFT_539734 [Pelagophyceae sp. CCMP2097]